MPAHKKIAQEILNACIPKSGDSVRIGITGVPGSGKSTFIERLGLHYHQKGKKIAVLAIDPSSAIHRGSILGDKTRMNELASLPDVFIRPSPAGEHLGGVHRCSRESILLCEAAGYNTILIETVGVGQSEIAVFDMTDVFLYIALPGAGDELQGIKRGIMEMAQILVVNKTDGTNIQRANETSSHLKNAIHYFPLKEDGWLPQVLKMSALEGTGITEVAEQIESFISHQKIKGYFDKNRLHQRIGWFDSYLKERLVADFISSHQVEINALKNSISSTNMNPSDAVDNLLKN